MQQLISRATGDGETGKKRHGGRSPVLVWQPRFRVKYMTMCLHMLCTILSLLIDSKTGNWGVDGHFLVKVRVRYINFLCLKTC